MDVISEKKHFFAQKKISVSQRIHRIRIHWIFREPDTDTRNTVFLVHWVKLSMAASLTLLFFINVFVGRPDGIYSMTPREGRNWPKVQNNYQKTVLTVFNFVTSWHENVATTCILSIVPFRNFSGNNLISPGFRCKVVAHIFPSL